MTDNDMQDPSLSDGSVPEDADLKPVDDQPADHPADQPVDPNDGEPDPSTLTEDEKDRELRHD